MNQGNGSQRQFAVYSPGDCIAIRLSDGDYGAALILAEDNSHKTEGLNLVAVLRYKANEKPGLSIFEKRNWLTLTHHSWKNKKLIRWCPASLHAESHHIFEMVGKVSIRPDDPQDSKLIGDWEGLGEQIILQHQWESEHNEQP